MIDLPNNKKIILFDGICNFCNNAVLKTINYDKKNQFVFASLQSEIGKKITNHLGIDTSKIDSIILYEPNSAYYIKSTAALKIMAEFGGFWKIANFLMVFPEDFRNLVYDYIAKNRYKWFGKKEECMIPTKEIREKFLE
ncbi:MULTISPECIES: thiol-disulfide oxidoreductase DCC family protein [unclassified Tenacibaculum]|uniref:thiol-disulfide oxidoreductase DCC family protein n=1 Tax=unclassified Tenacibaculum TaxID=2635139 RepID=UPI001F2BC794|nr:MULTISPECIES: DCC1-like thiol-disulfide oxidoreductase family protein [unclassified Tenacibaculum]MCF2873892.1 DCC1-like thiol-disulfide oxidoreductase family protein [Tenacibaculum sp. Cn5-1]MCF2936702.1 DCC1-like thiol-disulfide oxidoreductase family protein [Tenacibaculum sp. Cn5-34]MCG7512926.1 DCC1-like thiol-disulfide oxidoreductase family protein [Tenacibaculum sp. Cn5-46]